MNLLITGAWKEALEYKEKMEEMGHRVCFLQREADALPCTYGWAEGAICNGLFLHHPIEKFVNLKYIQLTSAGFDRVPMEYIQEHNIEIRNARGVYSVPMAEHAVGGVLQLYRQAAFFYGNQKRHVWEKHRELRELSGKQVCIAGCGSVGTECAKRFTAFDCRVVGVDIKPYENKYFANMLPLSRLDDVLQEADVVILTVPLTEQTYHLINSARLALMKPDAALVNISRGATVDTEALIEMLKDRPSFGAALDVFEEEPLEEASPLWKMENVILTPHNSFVGEGNAERLAGVICANLFSGRASCEKN